MPGKNLTYAQALDKGFLTHEMDDELLAPLENYQGLDGKALWAYVQEYYHFELDHDGRLWFRDESEGPNNIRKTWGTDADGLKGWYTEDEVVD